ncbi:uncharacterized protein LOC132301644 [Cornus florida]|uniref:uncharacterized protein LOC132301644 n=1 Tax=Cornus florida TaxID=4283 RepID=UPI00289D266D|nr:uncharacterized protein LOC132301644 [Cornus florida]
MTNGSWNFNLFQDQELQQFKKFLVLVPVHNSADKILWDAVKFSFKEARNTYRFYVKEVNWFKFCWGKARPRWFVTAMFVMLNKIPFKVNLHRRKLCLVSRCSMCQRAIDFTVHIFIECNFSKKLWRWIGVVLHWNMTQFNAVQSMVELFNWFQSLSIAGNHKTLFAAGLWGIWHERNARIYGSTTDSKDVARSLLLEVLDIHNIPFQILLPKCLG